MKHTLKRMGALMMAGIMACAAQAQESGMETFRTWAMTPPMGWNSWDCYYSSANEKIVMDNARYMADNGLDKYGWEYVVLDIRWYANHPSLGGGWYNQRGDQDCVLDEYGRYVPSPSRFPSCMVDGVNRGFKAMADSIHAMGLKFGIHIMRGLPKYILEKPSKYKLKGSENTPWSSVYKSTNPECGWLADNLNTLNLRLNACTHKGTDAILLGIGLSHLQRMATLLCQLCDVKLYRCSTRCGRADNLIIHKHLIRGG